MGVGEGEIRVEQFSFAYPGSNRPVLNNINLRIPRGEFVLVAGPSGCGKSTLALALAGLIPSHVAGHLRGRVALDKCTITALDIHRASQHIGMVFQNPDEQLIHLDVETEVAFGPENLGLPREIIRQRVDAALAYTQMEAYARHPIYALSGGQKQRVAIAAVLAMQPDVLVLDEPTSDLDPVGTQEVLGVLRRLNRERKMTIVLIEHKMDEVIAWVDRVLLMDNGRVLLDGAARKVLADEQPFRRLGVIVPEMVRLSHCLPEVFSGTTALSVEEAYDALAGSPIQRRLQTVETIGPRREPPHPDSALLQWKSVDLTYGDRRVLDRTTLGLFEGEWVALAGPNGSGKTSLASMAMGLATPTSGEVRFRGRPVDGQIARQAKHIGYLFQSADQMLFASKVRDEIGFGRVYAKKGDAKERLLDDETLARLIDLKDRWDDNPFHLSHGQRKRLAIGALLAPGPEMIILDEPTTGQDEGHAGELLRFLEGLRRDIRMTYLMITHDMRAVARYASRLVVLNEGRIVLDGPPSRVFAQVEVLIRASLQPPPIARLHAKLMGEAVDEVALDVEQFLEWSSARGGLTG